ncbi:MAG: hypothetical protein CSA45_01105 [Gammaproteobacteria bacterium]|nr:MAG: hypothetical protein CSA45_01105 [Gammaproteobacteria bacterium]
MEYEDDIISTKNFISTENYNPYEINGPTLMIGLGGLGSSIVRNVYDGLPDNYKANAIAHVMDTDVLELSNEHYAKLYNQGCVTQTSPPLTVGTCVEHLGNKTSVKQWFPPIRSLEYKQMIKGAAQVRAISRLAMLYTINSGRIDELNRNIDKLLLLKHDGLKDAIRVVIVNSLAGGTGSGSFMQIALYVREYLKQQHSFTNATFRSFLVMPEIFIKNGDYNTKGSTGEDMKRTVRANGYACFKELDALIRQRGGAFEQGIQSKLSPLFPMELEYIPNQKDAKAIEHGPSPFDIVTIFDYSGKDINKNIANLGNKIHYIQQVEDAIRLHLFSPLEGRGGPSSKEDNLANSLLASDGRGLYAGCGSSVVEYPFKEVSRYIALRWIDDGISKQWRELDELISDEIRSVLNDRAQGIHAAMPKRQIKFCELLRDKAERKQPEPFYKSIYDQTHELDEQGWRTRAKHRAWLETINQSLNEAVEQAIKEKQKFAGQLKEEKLLHKETIIRTVRDAEKRIKVFSDALSARTQSLGTPLAKEMIWRPYNRKIEFERGQEIQLNTWILGKDEPMHPIAIRYFLGEALLTIDKIIKKTEGDLKETQKEIDGYDMWDHPDTSRVEKTAIEFAKVFMNKPLAGWIKGPLKDFAEQYSSKYSNFLENLKKRAKYTVYLDAYKYLQGCLNDFLQYWEKWFENLDSLSADLQQELQLLETKHDNPANRTKIYVRSSSMIKKALWEEEGTRLIAEEVPTDISREIYWSQSLVKTMHFSARL